MTIRRALFALIAILTGLSMPAAASTSVAGRGSDAYSIVRAPVSSVDPGSPIGSAPALVLELRHGRTVSRFLVPQTDNAAAESFENLFFERKTNTVYALWQGYVGVHPVIYLAGFHDGVWQEAIQVTRDAFLMKFAPSMVVTRDSAVTSDGGRLERLVLHVLLAQEEASGTVQTLYAPVTFLDGEYVGPHPIYELNDMVADLPANVLTISPILERRPSLRTGKDERSIVAAFVDRRSGTLASIEIDLLPLQLSRVATESRASVIIVGSRGIGARASAERAAAVAEIHQAVRASSVAAGFVSEVAESFADAVGRVVADEPGSDAAAVSRIAGESRASVIIVGVRGRDRGLEQSSLADLVVSSVDGSNGSVDEDRHFSLKAARPAPRTAQDSESRIDVSSDGTRVIASWTDGSRFVRYRESEADGSWSDIEELALSSGMSLDQALAVLESKLRD